jgi:hypothetical protein
MSLEGHVSIHLDEELGSDTRETAVECATKGRDSSDDDYVRCWEALAARLAIARSV